MSDLLSLFGLDFLTIIWDFIKSILDFFVTIFTTISSFLGYLYSFNPVIAVIMLCAVAVSLFLGVLKIIKLIPMA
jgi:hypothetical protein